MKNLLGALAATCLLTASAMSPTIAQEAFASPAGQWEIQMRDSRYDVTLCGPDMTQLCAKLVWLGNGADNKDNLPYLNTMLIEGAKPAGPNVWKGTLSVYGKQADGTITQISDDQISIQGCLFALICKSYELYRFDPDAKPAS